MNDKPPTGHGKFFGRTVVITGASRGIGKEIALKLAKDGANVVIAAKTATAHPKLPGTIYSAAEEVEKAGGKALPCVVDVRDEASVRTAVESAVKKFGGIDILINNASAISLTNTEDTEMKRYDLMHSINTRGTFLMSKTCLPYPETKPKMRAHFEYFSPPLLMEPRWFSNHVAYTMAKYGMSMCVLGMHEEFRSYGVAVNALWPLTAIWTSAMEMLSDGAGASGSRKTSWQTLLMQCCQRIVREYTVTFVAIDRGSFESEGVVDFTKYAVDPGAPLTADFFIPNTDNYPETFLQSHERQLSVSSLKKAAIDEDIASVLANMKGKLSKDLVDKMQAVYEFTLTGDKERKIVIDLKNGNGSVAENGDEKADVKFTLAATDFAPMFTGKITPTNAFMSKKLKIKGDMTKALKLEGVLKKMNKSKL
ncbi:oxidoreductase, short chain dehydrogenase/reductase family protein [Ostertagia ostertagi]